MRNKLVSSVMSLLCCALVVGGCIASTAGGDSEESVAEAESAIGCSSHCECPVGFWCNTITHQCKALQGLPDTCYADCQCAPGFCGPDALCVPECATNCDCPPSHVCQDGVCNIDFGPHPQCRCDNHCLNIYELCIDNYCQPFG
jgi:hypothetical protein